MMADALASRACLRRDANRFEALLKAKNHVAAALVEDSSVRRLRDESLVASVCGGVRIARADSASAASRPATDGRRAGEVR